MKILIIGTGQEATGKALASEFAAKGIDDIIVMDAKEYRLSHLRYAEKDLPETLLKAKEELLKLKPLLKR